MTIYISEETVEKVKDNADIVKIVSDYLPLKRTGANYVGLCPFHNEKTPSFTVSESKQLYHCFGCGEGGDGVNFIMKKENLSFPEAIKFLADKLGIPIEGKEIENTQEQKERSRAFEINRQAARFFYNNLQTNSLAKEYLKNRKIDERMIRRFGLGYSLDSWDNLLHHLVKQGYKEDEIEKLGLIGKRRGDNGYYDRFRNRIIFPIIDIKSRVIGFGGRVLDDTMPKYLNSQDTMVFNKGNYLYGLNLLTKFSDRNRILLVEGYMDVIALSNYGINYSVASLGTAFTKNQGKLLKRYGENIYICFDSDDAGQKATQRVISILQDEDVNPKIIRLPNKMDPDDYINKMGIDNFEKLFYKALNHIDYRISIEKEKYNLENPEEKIKFTLEVSKIIKGLKSPVEQEVYIEKIALDTGISKKSIEMEVNNKNRGNIPNRFTHYSKEKDNRQNIIPVDSRIPAGNIKAELELIKLMIYKRDFYNLIINRINNEDFSNEDNRKVFKLIQEAYLQKQDLEEQDMINKILEDPTINKNIIENIKDSSENILLNDMNQVIEDLINTVLYFKLEKKRDNIIVEISEIENKSNKNDVDLERFKNLFTELTDLNKELKTFKM